MVSLIQLLLNFHFPQYDEITTSHNGFLTMAVEYGLFPVIVIVLSILFVLANNVNYKHHFLICMLIALLTQNLTNELNIFSRCSNLFLDNS